MNYGVININPETMGGTPVFTGTRVPVQTLFDYIEGGDDLNEFLDDYPAISKEAVIQVLEMAKKKHYRPKRCFMKILLDENLPKQLKADFGPDYEVKTVRGMGWLGKKNGELLGLICV
ncbi:MAG: DUF433 domain-containing protein [Segetibacter sp.]